MIGDVFFSKLRILHLAYRPQHPNQLWYSNILIELFQTDVSSFQTNNKFVDTFWSYCSLFKKLKLATCKISKLI